MIVGAKVMNGDNTIICNTVGFSVRREDDIHSVFYGPHDAVAFFVEGYGRVGKAECEAIELALYRLRAKRKQRTE